VGFAGLLGRRRVPMIFSGSKLPIAADADFCISGYIDPQRTKSEGPFGDHLGYYSMAHDFPVMRVEHVYHRKGAIWPFTVVGRPPQEDTIFGKLIHELLGEAISKTIPGVKAVHAVDAAGVHPLLLAIGSERYAPYEERRRPMELLTLANGILGQGQLSLAKYLWIVAGEDQPGLDVRHVPDFFRHALERVDWQRDLHFQTCTTIDTLDYSSGSLNEGSKVIIAAAGPAARILLVAIDSRMVIPEELGFKKPRVFLPGILVVEGPPFRADANGRDTAIEQFCSHYTRHDAINGFPLVVVVDQSEFTTRSLENFLWVTFTRSNPATDIYGIEPFFVDKHWGCRGSMVIDARGKPHHAPPLVEDPAVSRRVDALAAPGGPLHGII
ncbi:MAG TPA: UbiD family decarboxylase, partial [Thermoguttaceae bacterium]